MFELEGKNTPNLGDLTKRLRRNNGEIKRLEAAIAEIEEQKQPELTVSKRNIDELAGTLRYIVETVHDARKLRHFFSSFIDKIWLESALIRIEYRPECLIGHQEPIPVPSKGIWLPERSLLGTRVL